MSATAKPHYARMLDAPRSVWIAYELRTRLRFGIDPEYAQKLVAELADLLDPDGEFDPHTTTGGR